MMFNTDVVEKYELEVELPCPICGELVPWFYKQSMDSRMETGQNLPLIITCKCGQI